MTMKNTVQAVALWSEQAPSHSITAIMITDDQQTIVTGSLEGQICLWNLSVDLKISSRAILFGHTSSVTCLAKARDFAKQPFVVSGTENGEMCVWNVTNGQCIENAMLPYRHTSISYYHSSFRMTGEGWLLCCGQYQDVLIIDAKTLEVLHTLKSQSSDWIICMCIVHSTRIQEDSLVAISVTGDLKLWDLSSSINSIEEKRNVYETESKSLELRNCQAVRFCTYTERLLLIICSDCWKIFDYCDFSILGTEANSSGQSFAGGEFLAANRLILWTECGHGSIYQLVNSGLSKVIYPADGGMLKETVTPQLLCCTNVAENKSFSYVMGFLNERKEPFYKILFSGDACGRISFWHIPDVPVSKFDGSPKEIPIAVTSTLQDNFNRYNSTPEGIIGHFYAAVTSSLYIPSLDKLVCGCEDGKIIVTFALHAIRARLLDDHSLLRGSLPHRVFEGHNGCVTCLLYPHTESDQFDPNWLVSGCQDSSVILWDVFTGEILQNFTFQAGPVLKLLVPPAGYKTKVHLSVCCVCSDHSVALLHLQQRLCLLHARKHLFPVKMIKWHPVEDVLIVGCEDDSVYVWEIETGTLERYETGEMAKAILTSCEDSRALMTDSVLFVFQDVQRVKSPSYKTSSSYKLGTLSYTLAHPEKSSVKSTDTRQSQSPFAILPVKTKWTSMNFHVLLFDLEKLLEYLLLSQVNGLKSINSFHSYDAVKSAKSSTEKRTLTLKRNKTAGSLYQMNGQAKNASDQSISMENNIVKSLEEGSVIKRQKKKSSKKASIPASTKIDINIICDTAKLLLSCLFPWGVDKELDNLCIKHLGILRLQYPVSFGLVSNESHVSLMLPGWNHANYDAAKEHTLKNLFSKKVMDLSNKYINVIQSGEKNTGNGTVGTEIIIHLLGKIFFVSRMIKIPVGSEQIGRNNSRQKLEPFRNKGKNSENFTSSFPALYGVSQQNRHKFHFHDTDHTSLEKLISSWRDQSVEVIEAVQAVLLAEVQRSTKTLRRTSISKHPDTKVKNRMREAHPLPEPDKTEELELQCLKDIPVKTSLTLETHDNSSKSAVFQEAENVPDKHVSEEAESADDVKPTPWMSKVCFCKVC
ncbi:WD repeat-containing protein 72 isoform X2 [Microcaecilia unicolor]|uniref:WD repeat-containing protein 72 isoform X2 n=1 Tax=Microcaecilia unicolor TaxID=1415580 RepID=A0A6P7X4N4_9AMPH|nr:WD repeat-containing protein 72 isoform X2 [Microcaecilia unicolor]